MLSGKLKTDYEKALQGQFEFGHYKTAEDIHKSVQENKSVIFQGKKNWFILLYS